MHNKVHQLAFYFRVKCKNDDSSQVIILSNNVGSLSMLLERLTQIMFILDYFSLEQEVFAPFLHKHGAC